MHDSRCTMVFFFFFQAEDGIRDLTVTGVQTCALPIYPVGLVHSDQAHAPGQSLAPAAGDAAGDERVEDRALVHAQPGHDRDAEGGEDPRLVPAPSAPGDLAAKLALGVARDPDPVVAGLLAEAVDPGQAGGDPPRLGGAAGHPDVRQGAPDADILP